MSLHRVHVAIKLNQNVFVKRNSKKISKLLLNEREQKVERNGKNIQCFSSRQCFHTLFFQKLNCNVLFTKKCLVSTSINISESDNDKLKNIKIHFLSF